MKAILSALVVLAVWPVSVITSTTSEWNQETRDYIVKIHNDRRREENGCFMYKMTYDMELERRAKNWAEKCIFEHEMSGDVGENLGYSTYKNPEKELIETSSNDWFKEKKLHDYYDTTGCRKTCHYLQMVWGKTNKIGCYSIRCDILLAFGGNKTDGWQLVCFYSPKGNWQKELPYGKGCTSKCNEGETEEDGLCIGQGQGGASIVSNGLGLATGSESMINQNSVFASSVETFQQGDLATGSHKTFNQGDLAAGYQETFQGSDLGTGSHKTFNQGDLTAGYQETFQQGDLATGSHDTFNQGDWAAGYQETFQQGDLATGSHDTFNQGDWAAGYQETFQQEGSATDYNEIFGQGSTSASSRKTYNHESSAASSDETYNPGVSGARSDQRNKLSVSAARSDQRNKLSVSAARSDQRNKLSVSAARSDQRNKLSVSAARSDQRNKLSVSAARSDQRNKPSVSAARSDQRNKLSVSAARSDQRNKPSVSAARSDQRNNHRLSGARLDQTNSLRVSGDCVDKDKSCAKWAQAGECKKFPYLKENCKKSCNFCRNAAAVERTQSDISCEQTDEYCEKWAIARLQRKNTCL